MRFSGAKAEQPAVSTKTRSRILKAGFFIPITRTSRRSSGPAIGQHPNGNVLADLRNLKGVMANEDREKKKTRSRA
jgi:hypothetical protein